jgi:hypothetical protein
MRTVFIDHLVKGNSIMQQKALRPAVAVCSGILSLWMGAVAQANALDGAQIETLVTGKRIYLPTPLGGEFPLRYAAGGKVSGDGTALGLGKFMAPRETGRWWVAANRLCQQWPSWYDGKSFCFTLEQAGPGALRWTRDDGKSGMARIGS